MRILHRLIFLENLNIRTFFMSVNLDLKSNLHMHLTERFIIYFHCNLHNLSSNDSLASVIRSKAKESFSIAASLIYYVTDEYYATSNLRIFQGPVPCIISGTKIKWICSLSSITAYGLRHVVITNFRKFNKRVLT
jgi:hypothetical protein